MATEYVERREENYFVKSSRVSLDSVVYGFLNGESPETIRDNFPTLTLEQVYSATTFYLAREAEIDTYLKAQKEAFEGAGRSQTHLSSDLRARLDRAREQLARKS